MTKRLLGVAVVLGSLAGGAHAQAPGASPTTVTSATKTERPLSWLNAQVFGGVGLPTQSIEAHSREIAATAGVFVGVKMIPRLFVGPRVSYLFTNTLDQGSMMATARFYMSEHVVLVGGAGMNTMFDVFMEGTDRRPGFVLGLELEAGSQYVKGFIGAHVSRAFQGNANYVDQPMYTSLDVGVTL